MLAKPTLLCAIVAIACAAGGIASSQTFPNRPIRLVVGFAPAGPADVMARLIGQHLTSILGQGIVIDNRPGAGGTIGARAVAESDPDGYTLLLGNTSTLVISPLIYKNVNYDPVKGFAAIAALGTTSNLLIVNPALPVKSVQELVALARAHPGKLNYASAGIGTPPHLIGDETPRETADRGRGLKRRDGDERDDGEHGQSWGAGELRISQHSVVRRQSSSQTPRAHDADAMWLV